MIKTRTFRENTRQNHTFRDSSLSLLNQIFPSHETKHHLESSTFKLELENNKSDESHEVSNFLIFNFHSLKSCPI